MCHQVYAQEKTSLSKTRYFVELAPQAPISKIIISYKMGNIILEKQDETIINNRIEIDLSRYKSDNYYVILQYQDGKIEPQQVAKF